LRFQGGELRSRRDVFLFTNILLPPYSHKKRKGWGNPLSSWCQRNQKAGRPPKERESVGVLGKRDQNKTDWERLGHPAPPAWTRKCDVSTIRLKADQLHAECKPSSVQLPPSGGSRAILMIGQSAPLHFLGHLSVIASAKTASIVGGGDTAQRPRSLALARPRRVLRASRNTRWRAGWLVPLTASGPTTAHPHRLISTIADPAGGDRRKAVGARPRGFLPSRGKIVSRKIIWPLKRGSRSGADAVASRQPELG